MILAAAAEVGSAGWIIAIVIGILSALVSALVLVNVTGIRTGVEKIGSRMDKQEARIAEIEKAYTEKMQHISQDMYDCKVVCAGKFVTKEDWVRESGYTRLLLEKTNATLNLIEGKLDFVKLLPEMGAAMGKEIGQAIASELQKERRE